MRRAVGVGTDPLEQFVVAYPHRQVLPASAEWKVFVLATPREFDPLPVEQQLVVVHSNSTNADVERIRIGDALILRERNGQRVKVRVLRTPEPCRGDAQGGFGKAAAEVQVGFDVIQMGFTPARILPRSRNLEIDDAVSTVDGRDDSNIIDMLLGWDGIEHHGAV